MATFVDLDRKTPVFSDFQPTLIDSPTWLDVGELKVTLTPTFEDMNPGDAGLNRMALIRPPVPQGFYTAYTNNLLEHHRKEWVEQLLQRFKAEVTRLSDELSQMARHLFQFGKRMAVVGARVALVGGLLLGAMAVPQGKTQAANIFVNDPTTTVAVGDGNCSLPEAIQNANLPGGGDVTGGDCVAGGAGPDDIYLQNNVIESAFYSVFAFGSNTGAPVVTSDVTIHGNGNFISGGYSYRVLAVAATGTLTLDNVTVRDGYAINYGGGVYNYGGTVNVNNNSQVIYNYAYTGGGIFNNNAGTVNVNNSSVDFNDAYFGGGIANTNAGTVNINNGSVDYNLAYSWWWNDAGGGITNTNGGTVNVYNNSSVDNNLSWSWYYSYGGGIGNGAPGSTVNVDNSSSVDGNLAYSYCWGWGDSFGGGIDNWLGTVNVYNNSSVNNNDAYSWYCDSYGGGIHNYNGTVNVYNNSSVDNNGSLGWYDGYGGGIANDGGVVNIDANSSVNLNRTWAYYNTDGGGISTWNGGTVTVDNGSQVNNNFAYTYSGGWVGWVFAHSYGGGIANWGAGSTVAVDNGSQVNNNGAYSYMYWSYGGGIHNYNGTVNVNNSSVDNNNSLGWQYGFGGGINNDGGTVTVDDSSVDGNYARWGWGGGFANIGGTTNINNNSTVNGNNAFYGGGGGGNWGNGTSNINDSTTSGNNSGYGGGIANWWAGSTVNINNSTVNSNVVNVNGGGILNYAGTANIDGILLGGNVANNLGGGIYNYDGNVTITNSRILSNAANNGGGIHDDTTGGGAFNVTDSCIVRNSDTSVLNGGGATTQATNDWWGAVEGPGPIGPSVLGDTVSANVNFTPYLTAPILGCPYNLPPAQAVPPDEVAPEITVFDPAISKIGLLMPGDVGVTGEQIEWTVTASNIGSAPGFNVTVTDTMHDGLHIDGVDAPGGTVTIVGQTVTVTYAQLDPGQTVNFIIFTTVIDGVAVENTACVEDPTEPDGLECATALLVQALPSTGEIPEWDSE